MKKASGNHWTLLWLLMPVLLGVVLLVLDSRPQQALRNSLFDQYQRWHPRVYEEAPLRIVDIDEASLARLGQWPWPRTRMAELLDKLSATGAAAVGFDVMFPEPDRTSPKAAVDLWKLTGQRRANLLTLPDHDAVFARSLARGDAVVGFALERKHAAQSTAVESKMPVQKSRYIYLGEPQSAWLHSFSTAIPSLPSLEQAAKGNGTLTFKPDSDGVVRRVPLVFQFGNIPVGTLVSESLRVAQGEKNVMLKSAGHDSGLAEVRIGKVTIPTTAQGEIWVHYTSPGTQRYIPAWKVLAGQVAPEQLSGNIILIGSSAQGLMDLRFSPFGITAGVDAHAQALEQILTGHFLERPSWARGLEATMLMGAGLLAGLFALRQSALLAAGVTALFLVGMLGGAWYAFVVHSLLLDSVNPAIGLLLTFVVCSLWHHFSSEREQRWIKQAFARYVSPNRVAHLVNNPADMELGGKRQTCSFIFTDLVGFTSLMESIDPADAVAMLNAYLDQMIAIAFRYEGTLDRIVGDAVAIMFSAPVSQADHRQRALACALEMDAFANAFSKNKLANGVAFGNTRIGVHGGEVIVGNFGGSNIFDYRALGDSVNTAARLEGVNKYLGTRMCVSEAILKDCPDAVVRSVGSLVLKGKSQALAVFEPVTPDTQGRAPLQMYQAAFDALAQQLPAAKELFSQLAQDWPQDPLVQLHQRRLQAGQSSVRIVMEEK